MHRTGMSPVRRFKGEDGVSAVIMAICCTMLFGMIAFSVDAGLLWSTRRGLITDTDAAALAAARVLSSRGELACTSSSEGEAEAVTVLQQNNSRTTLAGFQVENCTVASGRVRVDARISESAAFSRIWGRTTLDAFSSSTAQWGPLTGATRVRPIALCIEDEHVAEWVALHNGEITEVAYNLLRGIGPGHPIYSGAGVTHRIFYGKDSEDACGEAPGTFDWLDFNSGGGGGSELEDNIRFGYDGTVSLTPHDCNPEGTDVDCPPATGAHGNAVTDALSSILCPATTATAQCFQFPIIIFDEMTGESGANARYHHIALLGVILRGFKKVTGTPKPDSYFDFEFVDLTWEGPIGSNPTPGFPSLQGISLCGTNYGGTIDVLCDV